MNTVKSTSDRIFDAAVVVLLTIVGILCLFPFLNVLAKSLSSEGHVAAGEVWLWPLGFNVKAYQYILTNTGLWNSMGNTLYVTILGTALNTLLTIFVAYTVSRVYLPLRGAIYFLYIFTMMFSGGIIPTYLVVKQVGLINHLEALFLPGLVSAFNVTILRNYFMTIPPSLEESAKMDGAGNILVLARIMTPLAMPSIATVALFSAVGYWNDFFSALIYITSYSGRTLQVFLRGVVSAAKDINMNDFDAINELSLETIRGATVFTATLPILLAYPFLQKYFVAGVMLGSVKE